MEISAEEQQDSDLDWSAVDDTGGIGHFTTAGFKKLPLSVASSSEDRIHLARYFEEEIVVTSEYILDERLTEAIPDYALRGDRYLRSFVAMASRGLYSFDIESYLRPGICYFRVALPVAPLLVSDLPDRIQSILGRTALKSRQLAMLSRLPYAETLEI